DRTLYAEATRDLPLLEPVPGGATRQDSVRRGLESVAGLDPRIVIIHDAVRPFLTPDIIDRVIAPLDEVEGAIAAVPVHDTLRRARAGLAAETIDRTDVWRAQTPQAFHFPEILAAHPATADTILTDDAAVAERAGLRVAIVEGAEDNIKNTTQQDLERAERILAGSSVTRVGTGFDVHRFGPGEHVTLGGVTIPHDRGLEGHSDAD